MFVAILSFAAVVVAVRAFGGDESDESAFAVPETVLELQPDSVEVPPTGSIIPDIELIAGGVYSYSACVIIPQGEFANPDNIIRLSGLPGIENETYFFN